MNTKTKKLPVSLSYGDFKTTENEFLIPFLQNNERKLKGFMGIKSGNRFPFGALSFVGKPVSASNILNKLAFLKQDSSDLERYEQYLQEYLEKLQNFKIGNILEIQYMPNGGIMLTKLAERPPIKNIPKIPG